MANNQFDFFTGELRTTTNIYPIKFTINNVDYFPLLNSFIVDINPVFGTKVYLQGGAGTSVYTPIKRDFAINFKIPIRVDINKQLDPVITQLLNLSFLAGVDISSFSISTAMFKTAQDFLTTLGYANFSYNSNYYMPLFDTCFISNIALSVSDGQKMDLTVSVKGSLSKNIYNLLFTNASALTGVNQTFIIDKVLTLADCRCLINGSYVPNINNMQFSIEKQLTEKRYARSLDNQGVNLPVYSPLLLYYSNDLPAKVGAYTFLAKGSVYQVLRTMDDDIYFSRGGIGFATNYNFITMGFGPIIISRSNVVVQQSTQPYDVGVLQLQNNLLFPKTPIVNQNDFMTIHTDGVW